MDKRKILAIIALILWVAGLTATIVGLNMKNETGTWMTAIGSPVFLVGLALTGILWFKSKK